ncbi:thymidylate synthase [Clostridium sp. D5]|nr:thymidylate synthase [Clostridium sp. D5]
MWFSTVLLYSINDYKEIEVKPMNYKTVYQGATAEVVEKKSRFIADVFPVSTSEEAMECLEKIKKQYWDARHHCWAYVTGVENVQERCSDDGEPSGTAGKPILEVIRGQGLHNVLIVVTRYFGGTLLGTGGLVRAYTAASKEGLSHSMIITRIYGFKLKISTDYTGLGKIQYLLAQKDIPVLGTDYTESVEITALVSQEEEKQITAEIIEGTNGKSQIQKQKECWFAAVEGEVVVFD